MRVTTLPCWCQGQDVYNMACNGIENNTVISNLQNLRYRPPPCSTVLIARGHSFWCASLEVHRSYWWEFSANLNWKCYLKLSLDGHGTIVTRAWTWLDWIETNYTSCSGWRWPHRKVTKLFGIVTLRKWASDNLWLTSKKNHAFVIKIKCNENVPTWLVG